MMRCGTGNVITGDVYYATRFMTMLGYMPDELPQSLGSFYFLIHSEDADRVRAAIQAHFDHHVPYRIEYRLRHKAGHYLWCEARGVASRNEQGVSYRMTRVHYRHYRA